MKSVCAFPLRHHVGRQTSWRAALVLCVAAAIGCASRPPAPGGNAEALPPGQSVETIRLDGEFTDWAGTPTFLTMDAPSPLASIRLRDTPQFLNIYLQFRDSVNLQAMPGTLHLLFQSIAGSPTSPTIYGQRDVLFSLDLSRLDKLQAGGRGAGFALRDVNSLGLGAFRSPYELDVAALPTWRSNAFELRLRRVPMGRFGNLGTPFKMSAAYVASDSTQHRSASSLYTFFTRPLFDTPPGADSIPAPRPGAVRVAQWNVSEGSFRQPEMHARLLAALTPDVLLLDEVYEQVTPDSLQRFFNLPALKALGPWQFVIAGSGGRQRTVVAARRRQVRPVESMAQMEYEPGVLDSIRPLFPAAAARRLIDIEQQAQISSVGAWVDLNGTDVMFVPLDLQSGGYAGNVQDALRILQARAIRAHVRAEISRRGQFPIVLGGDFNPVGDFLSVLTVSRDMDPTTMFTGLRPALVERLVGMSTTTWESEAAAQFAPGQLDHTFFRGLEPAGGFVFTTSDLSDRLLTRLGFSRDTFARVSDHLIVVSDYLPPGRPSTR